MWIAALPAFFWWDRRTVLPPACAGAGLMALQRSDQRADPGDPGDEAALELFSITGGQDVTEIRAQEAPPAIMGRRAVAEPAQSAQKRQLLGAEEGDIDKGLRPSQHAKQA